MLSSPAVIQMAMEAANDRHTAIAKSGYALGSHQLREQLSRKNPGSLFPIERGSGIDGRGLHKVELALLPAFGSMRT